MKRDMDMIRCIVLALCDAPDVLSHGAVASSMSEAQFAMHAQLLEEAGLVQAALSGSDKRTARSAIIFRLTWAGQDFAASIKNDTLWSKAKEHVIKPSASWTFGILKDYLAAEISRNLPGINGLS